MGGCNKDNDNDIVSEREPAKVRGPLGFGFMLRPVDILWDSRPHRSYHDAITELLYVCVCVCVSPIKQ